MIFHREDPKPDTLDTLIENHVSEMAGMDIGSDDYAHAAAALKILNEAKALKPKPNTVTADTALVAGANLAGILLIINYERLNVLTSKALSQVLKSRI